jgi:type III restriction enzyme
VSNPFFDHPILNSPYAIPSRHWELDPAGQPTQQILPTRRQAEFISPIPQPKKRKPKQHDIVFADPHGLSTEKQQFATSAIINELRFFVDQWRRLPSPSDWLVSPETARLLQHWRHHNFQAVRPFFCQVEAIETAIWLTEVAPKLGKSARPFLDHLVNANRDANPELFRLALKLATGAGKTTVMAMLIAWQTINEARHPGAKTFTRGFLIVAPGLTIKDRLRVLQPNDPDSYYQSRELVPPDMLADLKRAKIVITNYHAFKLRERLDIAKGTRNLLQGRGDPLETLETEGQMIQRVMPELMGLKNILVLNDEAHHCYRQKPGDPDELELKGEDREEAENNNKAARLWISGLEAVNRQLGITRVFDLSATPFFLRGSGYPEGTLFTWTMSDFSLMDAIECGIVKLPRVPVADNIPGAQAPIFRNLWENIRAKMPREGRAKGGTADPLDIPVELQTALEALYAHYAKTFDLWREKNLPTPPCFIVVCNNTSVSLLLYKYISGFDREDRQGNMNRVPGRLPLFRNFDDNGNPLPRPRTLLIDSRQLESGEALDDNFRTMAAPELEQFRRERVERSGDRRDGESETDQEILREVMNTVGKQGRLGESIRCVVSVSMLTEGWDANTVTHVLGVRAFGTQLLCEQVIGRALRRQSYELNDEGQFNVEYADILGIPFDFAAEPVIAPPQAPRKITQVKAVRPERDHLEIRFPRVQGYRVELPTENVEAAFTGDSILELTPALIGPSKTRNEGIIGEGIDLTLEHSRDTRQSTILYHLSRRLITKYWRDAGEEPKYADFNKLKRVAKQWLDEYLVCKGGTYPAQLLYQSIADMACERITAAITRKEMGARPVKAVLDPYNPSGSTSHVRFNTTKETWATDSRRCHVNYLTLDSGWEGEFCRVIESHPRVVSYVKNQGLNFEIPYRSGSETRKYLPDFIVVLDDGLQLIVEMKGYRREDAKDKRSYAETYWVPGVNNDGRYGRWAFAEFTEIYELEADFAAKIEREFEKVIRDQADLEVSRRQECPPYGHTGGAVAENR